MRVSFPVQAPPEAWAALSDPRRLAAALPGCRSVTAGESGDGVGGTGSRRGDGSRQDDGSRIRRDPAATSVAGAAGTLHVVTEVAVASVRGLWAGTVERVPAADAVRVRGSGTPGTVDVVVRVDPDRTAVTVEGTVEGPLATVGSSVLAAAVRRMAEDLLAAAAGPADPGATGDLTVDVAEAQPDVRRRRRLRVLAGALVLGGAAALGRRLVQRGAS